MKKTQDIKDQTIYKIEHIRKLKEPANAALYTFIYSILILLIDAVISERSLCEWQVLDFLYCLTFFSAVLWLILWTRYLFPNVFDFSKRPNRQKHILKDRFLRFFKHLIRKENTQEIQSVKTGHNDIDSFNNKETAGNKKYRRWRIYTWLKSVDFHFRVFISCAVFLLAALLILYAAHKVYNLRGWDFDIPLTFIFIVGLLTVLIGVLWVCIRNRIGKYNYDFIIKHFTTMAVLGCMLICVCMWLDFESVTSILGLERSNILLGKISIIFTFLNGIFLPFALPFWKHYWIYTKFRHKIGKQRKAIEKHKKEVKERLLALSDEIRAIIVEGYGKKNVPSNWRNQLNYVRSMPTKNLKQDEDIQ